MAYDMKSSPTKLGMALRAGKLLVKYGKKVLYSNPSSTVSQVKNINKTKPLVDETGDFIRKSLKKQLSEPVKK